MIAVTRFGGTLLRARAECGGRAATVAFRVLSLLAALALSTPRNTEAQSVTAGAQRATRAELETRAKELESQLAGSGLKGGNRNKATAELAAIRNRLKIGDFRVGDRFVITVRQDSIRGDTANVRDSLKVTIMNLPDISLEGVLRSELDERMTAHAARFLRNVSVRTLVLTRISVVGEVSGPGFYLASPDRPISEVVMLAGGPSQYANLKELEVVRAGTVVVNAKDSRRFLKEGRTLEQLDIQSGDEVRIPKKRRISGELVFRLFFIVSSMSFALLNFLQWYVNRQDG
ncbi:MAG: SLBB domain-containing protein [Gemmatimonadetes bacterium]|nr:SLBB domain-containing protein [Gemmatimonadota bacterium]